MGRPIGKHLGQSYNTFEVTFWINSVHLAQPIKLFYKTKGISLLIFKNLRNIQRGMPTAWGDLFDTLQFF